MSLFYQPFSSDQWLPSSSGVTFNPDGSVRLQELTAAATITYQESPGDYQVAYQANSNYWYLAFHGQQVTSGRIRWWTRNFNNTGYVTLFYPGSTRDRFIAVHSGSHAGGFSNWALKTEAAGSDITIHRWSLFSELDMLAAASGGSGSTSYSPFRSPVFGA